MNCTLKQLLNNNMTMQLLSDKLMAKGGHAYIFIVVAIAFAFETCQIFAIGAFVIWRGFPHINEPILPFLLSK